MSAWVQAFAEDRPADIVPDWPELFRNAVSVKSRALPLTYDSVITFPENPDNGELSYSVQLTPDAAPEVVIHSVPKDADMEEVRESLDGDSVDIWCDDYVELVGGPVELFEDRDASARFRFRANPEAGEDTDEKKLLEKTEITVEIDKATHRIRSFTYHLTEPVKPMPLAKIRQFDIVGQCAALPNGRTYVARVDTRVAGSALSRSFVERTLQVASNVRIPDQNEATVRP